MPTDATMAAVDPDFTREVRMADRRPLPVLDLGPYLSGDRSAAPDLAPDYFAPFFTNAHGYVRLIHYPPKPDLALNEYGLGAHSDTCLMTFLPHENEPGIQVMDADGQWFWPQTPTDSIMVNFGQLLERWSNGFVRATPHRVIPPMTDHRYSLPFFFSPNLDHRCECLPTCHGADNPPQYDPVSFQEFHTDYMSRVYAHFEAFDNQD